ncbi:hypothetical protein SDC9_131609 [bioreactor metagenome]|uniref:NodB homology domain-containing protein n=1 Tax=bioreactor metagenome TaxID=1076179 RepID=A0A645D583_9ZZZZ
MYAIQWDVDSLDWKEICADDIYKNVTSKVKNGSIVLFHNAALHTPEALPRIIETLQKENYQFVTVDNLIYKDNYKIDHTGKQIKCDGTSTTATASSETTSATASVSNVETTKAETTSAKNISAIATAVK